LSQPEPDAVTGQSGVAHRTLRGMAWGYASFIAGGVLVLASTAVLARLLDPDDFGLVALAITFIALLEGIADLGLTSALVIQKEEEVLERAETVFASTVAFGFALSAALAAASPLIASFFDEPELAGITAALGATFFIRSLSATHYALALKRLDIRARTISELVELVVRGVVGIVLAIAGAGVWSLVVGYLAGTVALGIALVLQIPWRPKLKPRAADLRAMIGFGGTITAVNLLATAIARIDYLFVGRALGPAALGLYTLGFRLPELLILGLAGVAGSVLFPAFTAVDREALGNAFLVSLRYTLMLALPLTVGLAVLAEPLILVAFGDRWEGSVATMQIVAFYSFAHAIGIPAGTVYKATGRAGVLLGFAVAELILLALLLALFVDRGIEAAAWSQAVVAALAGTAGVWLASRVLRLPVRRIGREALPTALATAAMAPALLLAATLIDSSLAAVIVGGVVGAGVYLGVLAMVVPDSLRYLLDRLRSAGGDGEMPPGIQGPADDPEMLI
jgi:PST family polysaccharide transporter